MELLDKYDTIHSEILAYFGYKEGWRVFPIDDARQYFWQIHGNDCVRFADTKEQLDPDNDEDCYSNELYYTGSLKDSVFRGADYTLIVVDTHTDGNKFLQIFANDKEAK